jgi:hypothetical protein
VTCNQPDDQQGESCHLPSPTRYLTIRVVAASCGESKEAAPARRTKESHLPARSRMQTNPPYRCKYGKARKRTANLTCI